VDRKVTQLPLASFGRRTLAFIVDFLLMLTITVLFPVPQVVSVVTGNVFSPELSMVLFITLALLWAYSTLFEGFNGQTLGKRLMDLKAVRMDGKMLSYDHAAIRRLRQSFLAAL
jgi:uncharacterized RDD family membrane protein YckC